MQVSSLRAELRAILAATIRHRASTSLAVLALGLGIGVNIILGHAVRQLLFLPPPGLLQPEQLVRLSSSELVRGVGWVRSVSQSYPAFEALRVYNGLADVAGYMDVSLPVAITGDPRDAPATLVTQRYFTVLGVRLALGRFWSVEEAGSDVVVLSYRSWKGQREGDPKIVGKTLRISNRQYTIIGVAERDFGGIGSRPAMMWVPFETQASAIAGADWQSNNRSAHLTVVGRLPASTTPDAATAYLNQRLRDAPPEPLRSMRFFLTPLGERDAKSTLTAVGGILAGLSLLLFIAACSGAIGLLLGRVAHRRRALAIHMALGAPRSIVPRTALLESCVFAAIGTVIAGSMTVAFAQVIERWLLPTFAWRTGIPVLWVVTTCAVAFILASAVVFAAELTATRTLPLASLLANRGSTRHRGGFRLSTALIAVQAAIVLILVGGAVVFGRSLQNLRSSDMGFDADRVIVVELVGPDQLTLSPQQLADRYGEARRQLERDVDVASTSRATSVPLSRSVATWVTVENRNVDPIKTGGPYVTGADANYFLTLGTKMVEGRAFTSTEVDARERVAVVNQTMARLVWPSSSAIGSCLYVAADPLCYRVVGVSKDTRREQLTESATLQFYIPLTLALGAGLGTPVLLARSADEDPHDAIRAVAHAVQAAASKSGRPSVQTLDDFVAYQSREWRMATIVFAAYAAIALLIAWMSLSGLILLHVEQRRRELAIRHALGATPARIAIEVATKPATAITLGALIAVASAAAMWKAGEQLMHGIDHAAITGAALLGLGTLAVSLVVSTWFGIAQSRLSATESLST